MRHRLSIAGPMADRGIYPLPCYGPNDEWVFVGISSTRRLVLGPVYVPNGHSLIDAVDALWDKLDELDPVSDQDFDALRRRTMRAV